MSDLDNNGIRFDTLYDYIVYFANSQFKGKEIYRCCHSEDSGYKENKTEELSRMASKKTGSEFTYRVFSTGGIDYENLLKLILEREEYIRIETTDLMKDYYDKLDFFPIYMGDKIYLEFIATVIAARKLNKKIVFIPQNSMLDDTVNEIDLSILNKYIKDDDFYIFSSGSTGLSFNPFGIKEKDLIDICINDYINKLNISGKKLYDTISISGIAGMLFYLALPVVGNNACVMNDKYNFFENIYKYKCNTFVLPLNYLDYLPIKEGYFNFVENIIIGGNYISTKDISNLLNYLPGLRKDAIKFLYSSTELKGHQVSCPADQIDTIKLNIFELLKGNVSYKDDIYSVEYLSVSTKNDKNIQIIKDGKNVGEDLLGQIKMGESLTDDLGIIHNGRLYVIGRKSENKINLSILENYFKYHLNRDVKIVDSNGELVLFVDIIGNYYSPFINRPIVPNEGVARNFENNYAIRIAANKLISLLEDNIEFYGDAITHKFQRNGRLEKVLFEKNDFNPDNNVIRKNSEISTKSFDAYYYYTYHFEEFIAQELHMLFAYYPKFDGANTLITIDDIYDLLMSINLTQSDIVKINNNPYLKFMFGMAFHLPTGIRYDFDSYWLRDYFKNKTIEEIRSENHVQLEITKEQKEKVRTLMYHMLEVSQQLGLGFEEKDFNFSYIANRNYLYTQVQDSCFYDLFQILSKEYTNNIVFRK